MSLAGNLVYLWKDASIREDERVKKNKKYKESRKRFCAHVGINELNTIIAENWKLGKDHHGRQCQKKKNESQIKEAIT